MASPQVSTVGKQTGRFFHYSRIKKITPRHRLGVCDETGLPASVSEKQRERGRKDGSRLRAGTALDPSLIPSTYVGQVTTACHTSSKRSQTRRLPPALHGCGHTDTQKNKSEKSMACNSLCSMNWPHGGPSTSS